MRYRRAVEGHSLNACGCAAGALVTISAVGVASADVLSSTWIGPRNGSWSNPLNWRPAGVPQDAVNVQYVVFIGPGSLRAASVVGDIDVEVSALTLGFEDSLTLGAGKTLDILNGPMSIDGVISLPGQAGPATRLRFLTDSDLGGGGAVILGGSGAQLLALAGKRITIGPTTHIQGAGAVGANAALLTNYGIIESTVGVGLTVDLAAGDNQNVGSLRAFAAPLTITGTSLTNSGVIDAWPGQAIVAAGTNSITGGVIGGSGGALHIMSGTTTLDGVSLVAATDISSGATLTVKGANLFDNDTSLLSGASAASLLVGPSTSIGGAANFDLGTGTSNRIAGVGGTPTPSVLLGADVYVHGSGRLGDNGANVTLEGLVEADQPGLGKSLTVDAAVSLVNHGMLRATTGELVLGAMNIDNALGTIESLATGTLRFIGTGSLAGGTLRALSGSAFTFDAGTWTMANVALDGVVQIKSGGSLVLADGANVEDVQLLSTGTAATLSVGAPVLALDNVVITAGASANNTVSASVVGNMLVFGPSAAFDGAGKFGDGKLDVQNHGTIRAVGGQLTLATPNAFTNRGTLEAIDATLTLGPNDFFDNNDGVITAAGSGTVNVGGGATVVGGTITVPSGPQLTIGRAAKLDDVVIVNQGGPVTLNSISLTNVTLLGDAVATSVTTTGTLTHVGTITAPATLQFKGPLATLTGEGTVLLQNGAIDSPSIGTILIHSAEHHIEGTGSIGNHHLSVINEGSIVAASSPPSSINFDENTGFFDNYGFMRAKQGVLNFETGTVTNAGTIQVDAGQTMQRSVAGVFQQSRGQIIMNGTFGGAGPIQIQGGLFTGKGMVLGVLQNSGGRIEPGDPFATGVGTLAIGNYTQAAGGTLAVDVMGAAAGQADRLAVTGTATLNGTLEVALVDGFVPAPGLTITILSAASRVGTFSSVHACAPLNVQYTATQVRLVFGAGGTLAGDFDGDGVVGPMDLGVLLGGWGPCPAACCDGDLDGDASVGGADLSLLLSNWS